MGARQLLTVWALALGLTVSANAQDMRIQFAEKVTIAATAGHTEFDAYGRRFSLDLRDNDRLLLTLRRTGKLTIGSGRVLRGELRGAPGSWVRLTRVGTALEGAIWDGRDLYVVTSKSRIDANLTLPIDAAPSQAVVYRLSDTLGGLPADFCGLGEELPSSPANSGTGLDQYKSLATELRANAAALAPNEQLDISLIADTAFQTAHGSLARDEMLSRLNIVDGIFSEQVGVMIVPTELRMIPAGSDPFTLTDAERLLDQLANYRNAMPEVQDAGLAHLMTGKNLDGNILGIAFRDVLCEPLEGVSLSDSEMGSYYSALVMAHELGHNFGAPHDGVPGSACSAMPQTFLMAPQLNGSSQFSQCSLTRMQDAIARARGVCIAGLHYADLTFDFPPSPFAIPTQQEFGYPITIRSLGNESALNATLRIQLPPTFTLLSAVLANGSCSATATPTGSTVTCQLGDVPGGESRTVELRLTSSSSVLDSYWVTGEVDADNDYVEGNNSRFASIGLLSAVDLGITLSANPDPVFEGETIDFAVDISSTRAQAAHGGIVNMHLGNVAIESFTVGPHACAIVAGVTNQMRCDLADVPSGSTTRITVRGRTFKAGPDLASASVSVPNDGEVGNNTATVQYSVRAEREIVISVSNEDLRAVIGSPYEIVYTLTSAGRAAATDVFLRVSNPFNAVESVVPSAGSCSTPPGPGYEYICGFGTLDPGEVRTVTVRLRFDIATTTSVVGSTSYRNGTVQASSAKFTRIYVNLRVDALANFFLLSPTLEGLLRTGTFEFQSTGIDVAQNVVATLDVPAPIRLLAVRTVYNPHGFQCALLTPQQARCTGSFSAAGQEDALARVSFDYVSDDAITASARLAVTADGDGNAANDVSTAIIVVNPFIDPGLALVSDPGVLVMTVGELAAVNLTLTTVRNPASEVDIRAYGMSPWYRVDSISVNGVTCPRAGPDLTEFGTYRCLVGAVPANSSYPVVVNYRAQQGGVGQGGIPIHLFALNDANGNNNGAFFNARTRQMTDVRVEVAQSSATATRGSLLQFPLITVSNTGALADDIVVDIPLPAFATVAAISSSGSCSGVLTLQCAFDSIAAGASATIDLRLLASADGTFASNVTMVADNDSTPANNSASVALSVTAPPTPPPSSSSSSGGGKKGGGSLEWLALAFLVLVGVRRAFWELAPRRL